MVDKTYVLDTVIQKPFFSIRYLKNSTNEEFKQYLFDFTLEQELGEMLDSLILEVSRSIDNETWFEGFDPDVEIILRYGNNDIFRGRVKDRDIKSIYNVEVFSSGEITSRRVANKVYNDSSPETIFADLISTYTDLTPLTPTNSGTIIERFVATEYIDSLIKKLSGVLDWQIRGTANKEIYLQPYGETVNSNTIYRTSSASNAIFGKWKEIHTELINRIIIVGDKILYNTTELFSGDDLETTFILTEIPLSLVVYISDVEQDTDDYTITTSDRQIVFDTAPTTGTNNIKIEYSYSYPIYCDRKNQTSIDTYGGEFVKKMWLSWIKTRIDAINYATAYLDAYKDPLNKNTLLFPIKSLITYTVGESVRIDDDLESIDDTYLIHKITAKYKEGSMKMEVGNDIPNFSSVQGYMMNRIKELEQNKDLMAQLYDSIQEDLTISETLTEANISYINKKWQLPYAPRCNYGRGTLYDARVGLCQCN